MLVSCAGARTYDSSFNVVAVDNTSLLLLNATDQQIAKLDPDQHRRREAGERGARQAQNTTVYVADETASRLYVLDYGTNSFVERPGYVDAGVPQPICPDFVNALVVSPAP